MINRFNNVLSDALLAAAEHACRAASERQANAGNVYHEDSGASAAIDREGFAKETKNWLT